MAGHLKRLVTIGLLAIAPLSAEARQGRRTGPAVEVGADVTVGLPDGDPDERRTAVGPRVTLHLTERNALVFFGDAMTSRVGDRSWYRTQLVGVEFRRAIYETAGFAFSGVAGTGVSRHQEFTESFPSVGPGNVPIIVPETLQTSHAPLAMFGVGVEQRLSSRFSLHGEVLLVGAEDASEYRLQLGFSVPLKPYSSTRTADSTRTPQSATYGSAALRTGQKLWVTSRDGLEASGKISAIDNDRIEIATRGGRLSFARADIGRIDLPDRLTNGTAIGAGAGAAVFGAFVSYLNVALCDTDDCPALAPALVGGAYGAAIGAAAGAFIDSLIDGRRTVFNPGAALRIRVAPSLNPNEAGARVQVSW